MAAVAAGSAALGPDVAGAAKKHAHHVTIKGTDFASYRFAPKKLTIKKGQTVHWSWNSNASHNVTFSATKHSATASQVTDFKLKFKKKGTFAYSCTVHGFTGKIVVD